MTALKVACNLLAAIGWAFVAWSLWHEPSTVSLILATLACVAAALYCVGEAARRLLP